MLDLVRLLTVPSVEPDTGYHLSPDGTQVPFSWNLSGQWEIYVLPLTPGAQPVCLTHPPGGKFAHRFSPYGAWLVLTSLESGRSDGITTGNTSTEIVRLSLVFCIALLDCESIRAAS